MSEGRIYSDDPLLRYKDTDIPASRSKSQIDGVLAEYGVQDVGWRWNKDGIDRHEPVEIFVLFTIDEVVDGRRIKAPAKVQAPIIWDKKKPLGRPPTPERVNWNVSMRAMYHFIYTHLNSAHAMRSSKIVAFLGYVRTGENQQLKDIIVPRLKEYHALENKPSDRREDRQIIDVELVEDGKS